MRAHAVNLSDTDIEKIAEYFSSFKYEGQLTSPENIQIIDEANSCIACHGPDGNSIAPTFPKIGGQYEDYLYHALKSYKNGNRNNAIMTGISSSLNEMQMKKLAKYFAKQKGMQKVEQGVTASEAKKD